MKDIANFNLKGHNTFGMDVACRRFIEFSSEDELISALNAIEAEDRPLLVIGGGSNILFTKNYEGCDKYE